MAQCVRSFKVADFQSSLILRLFHSIARNAVHLRPEMSTVQMARIRKAKISLISVVNMRRIKHIVVISKTIAMAKKKVSGLAIFRIINRLNRDTKKIEK